MWLNLIVALVLTVVSWLLRPKPKVEQPAAQDMDNPTASAGRPIPVLFGTVTVKGLNVLDYFDKRHVQRTTGGGSKK